MYPSFSLPLVSASGKMEKEIQRGKLIAKVKFPGGILKKSGKLLFLN